MGNEGGHGRSTSLPPELDAIDSGWDSDPQETAPRRTPSGLPFSSEPPTIPRDAKAKAKASSHFSAHRPLRPSERVTAAPPAGSGLVEDPFVAGAAAPGRQPTFDEGPRYSTRGSTDVRRTAETDPPSQGPGFPGPSSDPLELADFEDDDIYDRPTEDVFDRPTLDVQADELAFAQGVSDEEARHQPAERPRSASAELEFELEQAPVHPSALPTAPPPGEWQGDIGRLRTMPRPQSGRPADEPSLELDTELGQDSTPPRRTRTSQSPLSSVNPSYGPRSGLDLAQGDDIGPSLKPAARFKQEVGTLASGHTDGPHREMKDRFAMGDFSGALEKAESIMGDNPTDREAEALAQKCREVLVEMYASRIAGLDRRVKVVMAADQVRWLSLDHKSGFLLSMVDGSTSVEDLLDVCGMQRLDALKIICSLLDQNVIELG